MACSAIWEVISLGRSSLLFAYTVDYASLAPIEARYLPGRSKKHGGVMGQGFHGYAYAGGRDQAPTQVRTRDPCRLRVVTNTRPAYGVHTK